MTLVEVLGLPNSVRMPKLVFTFRAILKPLRLDKFWITELADSRGIDYKEAKIEFSSFDDAYKAVERLDKFLFNEKYPLSAKLLSEDRGRRRSPSRYSLKRSAEPYYGRSRSRDFSYERYYTKHSSGRERSRSPLYRDTSKLDLEIELLRKERMVIEEERKLLLEKKKLELIKEYGVSASREFEEMERMHDRRQRPRRQEPSPPEGRQRYRPRETVPQNRSRPKALPQKSVPGVIPQFVLPCNIILKQMKRLINEKAENHEKTMLLKLIRSQLRRRIAIELEDKDYMPSDLIVKLYREKYPHASDENIVTSTLNDLRASHVPNLNDGFKRAKRNNQQKVPQEKTEKTVNSSVPTPLPPNIKEKIECKPEPSESLHESQECAPLNLPKVKKELMSDSTMELNLEDDDDDWISNGLDWKDEDSKDA